jgi:hypothetical protein
VCIYICIYIIYDITKLSLGSSSIGAAQTPSKQKKNPRKQENHARSRFIGSILLISAVTTFQTVSYNNCGMSFATYLTDLVDLNFFTAAAITMILEYILDNCKKSIGMIVKMCWNYTKKIELHILQ